MVYIDDRHIEEAIRKVLEDHGWVKADATINDIVVVVTQRGFNADGPHSTTHWLTPTETPQYTVLGLLEQAGEMIRRDIWNSPDPTAEEDPE